MLVRGKSFITTPRCSPNCQQLSNSLPLRPARFSMTALYNTIWLLVVLKLLSRALSSKPNKLNILAKHPEIVLVSRFHIVNTFELHVNRNQVWYLDNGHNSLGLTALNPICATLVNGVLGYRRDVFTSPSIGATKEI